MEDYNCVTCTSMVRILHAFSYYLLFPTKSLIEFNGENIIFAYGHNIMIQLDY